MKLILILMLGMILGACESKNRVTGNIHQQSEAEHCFDHPEDCALRAQ